MKIHYLKNTLIGMLSLCLWGCTTDDTPTQTTPENPDGVYATLSVTAKSIGSFVPQSRWAPSNENAVCHEGEIQDVILFIYDTPLQSATASDMPKQIEYLTVAYKETVGGEKVYTIPKFKLSESLTAGTHYVFIIANPDYRTTAEYGPDCNKAFFEDKSLVYIRDYVYTGALYRDVAGGGIPTYDRFIMSSDKERSFALTQNDIDTHATVSISKPTDATETPIVVERLAARIDVAFGKSDKTSYLDSDGNTLTLNGDGSFSGTVAKIVLPVYDYDEYKKTPSNLVLTYDTYEITDIDVLNVVNDRQLMIQRQNGAYFQDENWAENHKTGKQTVNGTEVKYDGWYSGNTTYQASDCTKGDEDQTLGGLLVKNKRLHTSSDGVSFYTLGYYRENINNQETGTIASIKKGKTTVKLTGTYKRARDLNTATTNYDHNLEFAIMHCHLDAGTPYPRIEGAMAYAIGRNTIYRLCIDKILTDSEKVYVIWYYDSNNDGTYDKYATTTPFGTIILDKNDAPVD